MASITGLGTYETVALFKADTVIVEQVGDQVQINDLLSPGVVYTAREAGAETPDDVYTVRKTNDATKTFWASVVSNLLAGAQNLAFSALPDNTTETITLSVTGVVAGGDYGFGVVSGLPAGVEITLDEESTTADQLKFNVTNNTGATLTADTIVVNVYSLGK